MTSNFDVRLYFHLNDMKNHNFTHNADDWVLFHKIDCDSKLAASKIEKHIKSMKSRIYIENLNKYPEMVVKLLEKYSNC